ncbi:hypothetical protein ZWY2020_035588 [Hordeum vulgare]|nr:hypothetical protein ZWY2020_035588 [Hordeum vulgare]
MPPPPATLPDELHEEILLRLPPDDPCASSAPPRVQALAQPPRQPCLLPPLPRVPRHASLAGVLRERRDGNVLVFSLVPTSPFFPIHPGKCSLFVLDARHGLVLSNTLGPDGEPSASSWDPVGHRQWRLSCRNSWTIQPSRTVRRRCSAPPMAATSTALATPSVWSTWAPMTMGLHKLASSSESRAWSPVTSCEHLTCPCTSGSVGPMRLWRCSLFLVH